MESFLKKVFDGKANAGNDELVHVQFQKFSRGEYKDKAVVLYSHSKDKYSLSTTYEYANEFVRMMAEKLDGSKTMIAGVIVSTRDLKSQLRYSSIKQFAGIKQYIIDGEMSGKEIIELLDKLPAAFFALSFKLSDGTELKIKAKAPISGKPSTKANAAPKADFCKFYTTNKELVKNFVFDSELNDAAKKAEIKHIYSVRDIILPQGEKDPFKIRELAKRKGVLIRLLKIDGVEHKKEGNFLA